MLQTNYQIKTMENKTEEYSDIKQFKDNINIYFAESANIIEYLLKKEDSDDILKQLLEQINETIKYRISYEKAVTLKNELIDFLNDKALLPEFMKIQFEKQQKLELEKILPTYKKSNGKH